MCLVIMFTSRVFSPDNSKKLVTVWEISLCTSGRSHRVLAENDMFNRLSTQLFVRHFE